jgi:hypothetical protein
MNVKLFVSLATLVLARPSTDLQDVAGLTYTHKPTDCDKPKPIICKLRKPSCHQPKPGCISNATYGAVLFEQSEWAGDKHWIDGTSGECRGLNGTQVASILFTSTAGGDVTYGAISDAQAAGVTLTFYDNFGCSGNALSSKTGNQWNACSSPDEVGKRAVGCIKPLSVKIECNGRNSTVSTELKPKDPFNIVIYEEANFNGTKHWTDARYRECRGLDGYPVASVRYVSAPGGEEPISDADAKGSRLVFYDDYGCKGSIIKSTVGNVPQMCTTGNACNPAKSVMFLPPVRGQVI